MSTEQTDGTGDSLVADFLSGDGQRMLHAVWEIFKTRDPRLLDPPAAALPRIRAAADEVNLGGMLVSNNANLNHVLCRLEIYRRGQCLCAAYDSLDRYDSSSFYDVEKEESRGHVKIVGEIPVDGWIPIRICECTGCGRRFEVEQGESHYTWWHWAEAEERNERA